MKVNQVAIGRFWHFHLARQLEKRGWLEAVWTGYPLFKLRDEKGIPSSKIKTYPWVHTLYMAYKRFGLPTSPRFEQEWEWLACQSLDKYVAANIDEPTILVALSSTGLLSGVRTQKQGGFYICDRGSSHIRFQNQILTEEYKRWKLPFKGIDPRIIAKEEAEYACANKITVPSGFVSQSFIQMGIAPEKLVKINYGVNLDRFSRVASPAHDTFRIIWVGAVSVRKGFMYVYEAFRALKHPKKELVVIGAVTPDIKQLLVSKNLDGITFKGIIPNQQLPFYYSTAHVFVLPSIEEGLAMVQGEAMACGCPIIATPNSGSEDLYTDGCEGFIVSPQQSVAITERLQQLADAPLLRSEMAEAAIQRVKKMNGWDQYGSTFASLLSTIQAN